MSHLASKSSSSCPKRHQGADQNLWKIRSKEVISQIAEKLSLGLNFVEVFDFAASQRSEVAKEIAPTGLKTDWMGVKYEDGSRACEIVGAGEAWKDMASVLCSRLNRSIYRNGEDVAGCRVKFVNPLNAFMAPELRYLQVAEHVVELTFKFMQEDGIEKSSSVITSGLSYDKQCTGFYLLYAEVNHESSGHVCQAYLEECLNAGNQDVLLSSLAKLMHYMSIHLRVRAGNAAIAQWISTAILKYHGYESDFFVENGFPLAEDRLPFDWVALLTPDLSKYIAELTALFEICIKTNELDQKVNFKGSQLEVACVKVFKSIAPTEFECLPEWAKDNLSNISCDEFWSLPKLIRRVLYSDEGVYLKGLICAGYVDADMLRWFASQDRYESFKEKGYLYMCDYFYVISQLRAAGYGGGAFKSLFEGREGCSDEFLKVLENNACLLRCVAEKLGSAIYLPEIANQRFISRLTKIAEHIPVDVFVRITDLSFRCISAMSDELFQDCVAKKDYSLLKKTPRVAAGAGGPPPAALVMASVEGVKPKSLMATDSPDKV